MPAFRGTPAGASETSASTMPTISAANSAADGTPIRSSGTVTATVTATNSAHFHIKTSMRLLFHDLKLGHDAVIPRYNLVMSSTAPNPATELRESIMALTRQLRRHRSDNGLTLSQQQVLGEVSRAGVTTPAELATRMHVRVQSLTDGINHLESRGLVARRTDDDDRRRQLIEV